MAMTTKDIAKRMRAIPSGTPGANNPSGSVRSRTTGSGKGVVPAKAKTPKKTKQKNKFAVHGAHSTPVGYKNKRIKRLKGGKGNTAAARKRGGYGAARANLGFAAANQPIKPVIGRAK